AIVDAAVNYDPKTNPYSMENMARKYGLPDPALPAGAGFADAAGFHSPIAGLMQSPQMPPEQSLFDKLLGRPPTATDQLEAVRSYAIKDLTGPLVAKQTDMPQFMVDWQLDRSLPKVADIDGLLPGRVADRPRQPSTAGIATLPNSDWEGIEPRRALWQAIEGDGMRPGPTVEHAAAMRGGDKAQRERVNVEVSTHIEPGQVVINLDGRTIATAVAQYNARQTGGPNTGPADFNTSWLYTPAGVTTGNAGF
ncbi:MAG: hypothetical protein WCC64_15365, partial [Aliidongia sp.]